MKRKRRTKDKKQSKNEKWTLILTRWKKSNGFFICVFFSFSFYLSVDSDFRAHNATLAKLAGSLFPFSECIVPSVFQNHRCELTCKVSIKAQQHPDSTLH